MQVVKSSEVISSVFLDDILLWPEVEEVVEIFISLTYKLVNIESVHGVTDISFMMPVKKCLLPPIGNIQFT
jgi:hypothetical protein